MHYVLFALYGLSDRSSSQSWRQPQYWLIFHLMAAILDYSALPGQGAGRVLQAAVEKDKSSRTVGEWIQTESVTGL